jgi:hypothetical protein
MASARKPNKINGLADLTPKVPLDPQNGVPLDPLQWKSSTNSMG